MSAGGSSKRWRPRVEGLNASQRRRLRSMVHVCDCMLAGLDKRSAIDSASREYGLAPRTIDELRYPPHDQCQSAYVKVLDALSERKRDVNKIMHALDELMAFSDAPLRRVSRATRSRARTHCSQAHESSAVPSAESCQPQNHAKSKTVPGGTPPSGNPGGVWNARERSDPPMTSPPPESGGYLEEGSPPEKIGGENPEVVGGAVVRGWPWSSPDEADGRVVWIWDACGGWRPPGSVREAWERDGLRAALPVLMKPATWGAWLRGKG